MTRARGRLALWTGALLLLLCGQASADEVVHRTGKTYRGFPRTVGDEIHLNEYGCSAAAMTLGVRRLRRIDVREIRPAPLVDHLHARLAELGPRDIPRRVDLLREAQSGRAKPWVQRIAAEILVLDPKHDEALRAFGGSERWDAQRRGDLRFDRRLEREIRMLLRLESGSERRARAGRIERDLGYAPGAHVLERMVHSQRADRGLTKEIALRYEAGKHPGATYSLYVPERYDPLEPTPLLVALHGGGMLQAKDAVRGSAADARALFLEVAQRLGWLLVCPTAIEAPWSDSKNMQMLEAVLAEVTTLWNVDLERVHVAGQGGGGDGALAWAARKGDRFASVSIASAGRPRGLSSIVGKTAVWIYHGEGDEIVPVEPVRKAAAALLRKQADFVYCELPREGHGLAPAARRDMVRYIAPKRRKRAKTAWPRSSFGVPRTKRALEVFGDPAAAWGEGFPDDPDTDWLLAVLTRGQADAEHAARRLQEDWSTQKEKLAPRVRAVLADRERPREARVWSAWLLGRWRVPEAVNELGDTLRVEKDARLLRVIADAVGRIGSPDSTQDLRWAVTDLSQRFRSLKGNVVRYQDWERTCRLGAAVAEAIGRCVPPADAFFAEMEENLVRHVLMDRRPVAADPQLGEEPSGPRALLAGAVARAYRQLKAEKTLFDMLLAAVRGDALSTKAVLSAIR